MLAEAPRGQSIYLNRTHRRSRPSRVCRRRGPGPAAPVPARRQVPAEWSPRRAFDRPQNSRASAQPARYTSRRPRVPKIPTRALTSPNVSRAHRKSPSVDAGRPAQARPLHWFCAAGRRALSAGERRLRSFRCWQGAVLPTSGTVRPQSEGCWKGCP